jgi:hypothetical protein
MEAKQEQGRQEDVIQEFPALGKYRIRLIANPKKPAAGPTLDIREFVATDRFEGFTRRGIRLGERKQLEDLQAILAQVLGGRLLPTS